MPYLRNSPTDWEKFQKAGRTSVTPEEVSDAHASENLPDHDPPSGEVRPDAKQATQWHQ
jgi:hypothetical protein